MTGDKFQKVCKKIVVEYINTHIDVTDKTRLTEDDVYVVWCCKTLQNNKALVSAKIPDGLYYEITYNGDKDEVYVDVYKKWTNYCSLIHREM